MLGFFRYLWYGWLILITAILVNLLAKGLGILTWYDYLEGIWKDGFLSYTRSLQFIEVLFLFIIYPGIFGFIIYLVKP